MDWKLFAQLTVTVIVAMAGGWLGHSFAASRDLVNERRKLRVSYLLEAYRRLEDGSNRSDDPDSKWTQIESAVADIQLLGSPHQATLTRDFSHNMAHRSMASVDSLIQDLRHSLRQELDLPPVNAPVAHLRFSKKGAQRFDTTLVATIREVAEAKIESAELAPPDARHRLDEQENDSATTPIIEAWNEIERMVVMRLNQADINTGQLGSAALLQLALQHDVITEPQYRSLHGLNVLRNLAVHSPGREINAGRIREFLILAESLKTILGIVSPPARDV